MRGSTGFIFGLAVGAAAGVLTARYYVKDKYMLRSDADREMEEYKAYMNEKYAGKEKRVYIDNKPELVPKHTNTEDEEFKKYSEGVTPYNTFSSKIKNEEEEHVKKVEEAPYEIEIDEFADSDDGYRKVGVRYFSIDDVYLLDTRDEVVDDPMLTFGVDNIDKFTEQGINTMYIRDPNTSTDYELIRIYGSYEELIVNALDD